METTIQSVPKPLMQPFPHPNDASYKIWSRLANWLQRYSSFIWIMMERRNDSDRMTERQGKSSIAPTFSKPGFKKRSSAQMVICLTYKLMSTQQRHGWMSWFMSLSTVFQSFRDNGRWTWKVLCNEAPLFKFGKNPTGLAYSGIRTRDLKSGVLTARPSGASQQRQITGHLLYK